jgi:TRAP-type uncharacterized transport system fused permease subunit
MFVYSPELLMLGSWTAIVPAFVRAGLGVFCLAAGLQGWLRVRASPLERAMLIAAGGLLVAPDAMADVAGLVLFGLVWVMQTMRRTAEVASAPAASLD